MLKTVDYNNLNRGVNSLINEHPESSNNSVGNQPSLDSSQPPSYVAYSEESYQTYRAPQWVAVTVQANMHQHQTL